ncbi:right-handed parallel beta-helix repeat-containing protein [Myxococcota bacterium]|nr:right-handed parallel beta-helix repeat-containing protein [Myxococcota bacterium]
MPDDPDAGDGGGSDTDGGGSDTDGGGSDGGGSDTDGGGSDTDGGGSDTDGGGSDGGGSATDGGGTTEVYDVCADGSAAFTDLQDAVDASEDGDVLRVCAGSYTFIELDRQELEIVGVDGADVTFFVGELHSGLSLTDSALVLSGFTFTGTAGSFGTFGLYCLNSDLAMRDVRITGAEPSDDTYSAHGLLLESCVTTIEDMTVQDNTWYGTIIATYSGSLVLRHSVFRDNIYGDPLNGSGFSLLSTTDTDAEVSNNLFFDNQFGDHLVRFVSGSAGDAWVYNNVFDDNRDPRTSAAVSPVYLYDGTFVNNIVVGTGSQHSVYGEGASVTYNDLWDHSGAATGGSLDAHDNLEQDPAFVSPMTGDFTLDPGFSPCIDAGDPLPGYDDADGSRNDMGAFGGSYGAW